MRILLDTNVLISAFVFGGTTRKILKELLLSENEVLVSEYVENEFKEKLYEKWPTQAEKICNSLRKVNFIFCESSIEIKAELRDPKDDPILADAKHNHADIILTRDNDFLESGLKEPKVYSPQGIYDLIHGQYVE